MTLSAFHLKSISTITRTGRLSPFITQVISGQRSLGKNQINLYAFSDAKIGVDTEQAELEGLLQTILHPQEVGFSSRTLSLLEFMQVVSATT